MRHLRILGLTFVAAMALTAALGAVPASATETALCAEKTTIGELPICEETHLYDKETTIHAVNETFLLIQSPLGNIECEESTLKATTEDDTALPLGAKVESLTFSKCTGGTLKTVEAGTLDIEIIDQPAWTHNGTLTFTGTKIELVKGIKCFYTVGHAGTLTGGPMATIDLSGTLTKVAGGSGLCPPNNVTFIGFYTVTSPEPLWISM